MIFGMDIFDVFGKQKPILRKNTSISFIELDDGNIYWFKP